MLVDSNKGLFNSLFKFCYLVALMTLDQMFQYKYMSPCPSLPSIHIHLFPSTNFLYIGAFISQSPTCAIIQVSNKECTSHELSLEERLFHHSSPLESSHCSSSIVYLGDTSKYKRNRIHQVQSFYVGYTTLLIEFSVNGVIKF